MIWPQESIVMSKSFPKGRSGTIDFSISKSILVIYTSASLKNTYSPSLDFLRTSNKKGILDHGIGLSLSQNCSLPRIYSYPWFSQYFFLESKAL